jgi:capsular polysaccharide transport system ATP-binding protein
MLRLDNITKRYRTSRGPKTVLDKVSLQIERGQKWGVLGSNGSGKSTLVRVIAGAEAPSSGTVEAAMSVSWPLAFGGGFQGGISGLDNARFVARVYGADIASVVDYVESFAELGAAMKEPVMTYSSGMRARLAFGLSLAIDFDCLLIDEIVAVGDHRFREKCDVELYQKRAHKGWVLVSHDANYVREHCTHAAVLSDGRLRLADTVDEAIHIYQSLP